jgi:hypothetical protein
MSHGSSEFDVKGSRIHNREKWSYPTVAPGGKMWGQKQNLFSIILHIMHDDPTRMTGLISLHLCGFLQLKLL